jgi:hypothetical protein
MHYAQTLPPEDFGCISGRYQPHGPWYVTGHRPEAAISPRVATYYITASRTTSYLHTVMNADFKKTDTIVSLDNRSLLL